MNRIYIRLGISLPILAVLLFSLPAACSPMLKVARQQLNITLEQLPELDTLIPVFSMNEDFISTEGEFWDQCVSPRTYIVYASKADKSTILDDYVSLLEDSGWEIVTNEIQMEEWEWGRLLTRGDQEVLWVNNSGPGPLVAKEFDYKSIQAQYPTIISVMITHMRPRRDEC